MTSKHLNKSNIRKQILQYGELLAQIKTRIHQAQTRAVLSANAEMIHMYWDVGRILDAKQKEKGWGSAIIPKLSKDIHNEFPEVKGFSERNLKRMIAFYRAYSGLSIFMPHAVAQNAKNAKVPQPVAQIDAAYSSVITRLPWGHHFLLLEKVKNPSHRLWYIQKSIEQGWSRNVLALMIEGRAYERQGRGPSNFKTRLPAPQSDLVQQALKDPYIFDFLTLEEPFHERELETGLIKHLEKFLIELGQGFAFVGRQYHVDVGDNDFYIDLLFYHLKLRCFVVIELKKGPFKPDYAGKMNFYCNVIDDFLKHHADNPTIGLILCQDRNKVLAEYALKNIRKPIGVSQYELTRALPKQLKSSLPTIAQIEAEFSTPQKIKKKFAKK